MLTRSPDKTEILEEIRRTAIELGKNPSRSAFIAHTGIREYHVLKYFPSWNSAVAAAGLDPDTTNVQINNDSLLGDWGDVVRQLRQIPTRVQYRQYGKFSTGVFEHHFGPWSRVPDKFREFAADKPESNDVLALLPVQTPNARMTDADLAGAKIGNETPRRSASRTPFKAHSKLRDRSIYGNPIDFRGLRHEPVNENGVIFLFGIVARELGYSVEAVQAGFRDCEAKRQIDVGKWQRVRIEFEFESKNFRDHGHPANQCDLIICWRHNWPECPDHIEVLELSRVIKQLGKSDEA
ncbi:MAG: homing endonuclease associated repeat-containing protein [Syntrophobacteraceae bacterium]